MPITTAAVHDRYGGPEELQVREVDCPEPGEGRVLVDVRAASVNPLDWHSLTGRPWIARSQSGLRLRPGHRLGTDVAGVVVALGPGVTTFAVGDAVFGAADGALGGLVLAKATSLAHKPEEITFEQAGAVAIAGVTALQALRDKGKVGPGSRVLVNGAAGGVGSFAVQLAKGMGATVTGVCGPANVQFVRDLGADAVVDYTKEAVTSGGGQYDVIVDNQGNHSARALKRVLVPGGVEVVVGGKKSGRVIGPLATLLRLKLAFLVGSRRAAPMMAKINADDLATLAQLMAAGSLRPAVTRTFPLADVATAFAEIGAGHARGKLVVVP
ncbi:MAG: NAD(P)-dependent alcohol dehydrogenase [Ilumatobacter sp.]|nr:NAD(P)-dependent alcohol dehydrogenase [Ilumatobacter sp.]